VRQGLRRQFDSCTRFSPWFDGIPPAFGSPLLRFVRRAPLSPRVAAQVQAQKAKKRKAFKGDIQGV